MTSRKKAAGTACPATGRVLSAGRPSPSFSLSVATRLKPARPKRQRQLRLHRLGRAILAHRVFGYVFLAIYIVLMVQMVPRLWTYQIEFPARTVVHISLGMAIGVVLLLKIAIVRFFRRLDQSLVPSLGTLLLVGSVVLIGISVPSAFREALATGRLFSEENRQRVRTLLAQTGLDEAECTRLTTPDSLRTGQRILRQECIDCHDLRTVLAKPRTPENWRQTVRRMADRTTMLNPLEENEQLQVTAYLVALSPDLQKSARAVASRAGSPRSIEAGGRSRCHGAGRRRPPTIRRRQSSCSRTSARNATRRRWCEESPPGSEDEARELVARMVDEGLGGDRRGTRADCAVSDRIVREGVGVMP